MVLDQYCLKKGCSCTDVSLSLLLVDPNTSRARDVGGYFVDYAKKKWRKMDELIDSPVFVDFKKAIHRGTTTVIL